MGSVIWIVTPGSKSQSIRLLERNRESNTLYLAAHRPCSVRLQAGATQRLLELHSVGQEVRGLTSIELLASSPEPTSLVLAASIEAVRAATARIHRAGGPKSFQDGLRERLGLPPITTCDATTAGGEATTMAGTSVTVIKTVSGTMTAQRRRQLETEWCQSMAKAANKDCGATRVDCDCKFDISTDGQSLMVCDATWDCPTLDVPPPTGEPPTTLPPTGEPDDPDR